MYFSVKILFSLTSLGNYFLQGSYVVKSREPIILNGKNRNKPLDKAFAHSPLLSGQMTVHSIEYFNVDYVRAAI